MSNLQAFAHAHWHAIMYGVAVWFAIGNALSRKWSMPPKSAKWYVKAAHFILVNLPQMGRALQGRTIWGFTFAVPFLSWTMRPDDTTGATPPPANGQSGRVNFMVLMAIALGSLLALAAAGCSTCNTMGTATCARKALTGVDAVDGAAARLGSGWVKKCGADAKAKDEAGDLKGADAAYSKCEKTGTVLVTVLQEAEDAVDVASPSVDAAEAAGAKDYTGLLAPVYDAVKALYKAFSDAGIKLPVVIPGVL